MFRKFLLLVLVSFALFTGPLGCNQSTSNPTPNTQATINAAVAATDTAQIANQATIDAAVKATTEAQAIAQATTVISAPTATSTSATVPPAEETVTMTEAEMVALIDQAVTEAVAASEQYSTAATETTTDNTVTQDEVQTVEVYYANADEAIAYAESLIGVYYDLYGALAVETVQELEEIEEDLAEIAAIATELYQILEDVDSTLAQGLELAEETIIQLETTARIVSDKAEVAQTQAGKWQLAHQIEQDNQIATVVAVQANSTNTEPQAVVQDVIAFAQVGQASMADSRITPEELAALAQMGANVGAGLNASGVPQLQELSGVVTVVTEHIAGGNIPQAQAGLNQLGIAAPLALPPNQVAQEPRVAIENALQFAATGRDIMADNQVTPQELANLAQLGANAGAGLNASGIPQLEKLSGVINDITGQISLGQASQAQLQLDNLNASLISLPDIEVPPLPERPSIEKPAIEKPVIEKPFIEKPDRPSK